MAKGEERIVAWCGPKSALASGIPRDRWHPFVRLCLSLDRPLKMERFYWGAERSDWHKGVMPSDIAGRRALSEAGDG